MTNKLNIFNEKYLNIDIDQLNYFNEKNIATIKMNKTNNQENVNYLFKLKFNGQSYLSQYCDLKGPLEKALVQFNDFMNMFKILNLEYYESKNDFMYHLFPEMFVVEKENKMEILFKLYFKYPQLNEIFGINRRFNQKNKAISMFKFKYFKTTIFDNNGILLFKDSQDILSGSLASGLLELFETYYTIPYTGGTIKEYTNLIEMQMI